MGEFMRQQSLTGVRAGSVLPAAENNVRPRGVGQRVDAFGGSRRLIVGMDADMGEIPAEAGLEERAALRIERLAGRVQHLVDDAGRLAGTRFRGRGRFWTRDLALFPFTSGALTAKLRRAGGE